MSPPVSEFYDDDEHLVAVGESALKHFGTPGMKWGKRKSQRRSAETINRLMEVEGNPASKVEYQARGKMVLNHLVQTIGDRKMSTIATLEGTTRKGDRTINALVKTDIGLHQVAFTDRPEK